MFCFLPNTDSATEVIDQLFENVAARLAGNKKCESVDPLPGCSITSDCLQITCNVNFVEKQAALRATINRFVAGQTGQAGR